MASLDPAYIRTILRSQNYWEIQQILPDIPEFIAALDVPLKERLAERAQRILAVLRSRRFEATQRIEEYIPEYIAANDVGLDNLLAERRQRILHILKSNCVGVINKIPLQDLFPSLGISNAAYIYFALAVLKSYMNLETVMVFLKALHQQYPELYKALNEIQAEDQTKVWKNRRKEIQFAFSLGTEYKKRKRKDAESSQNSKMQRTEETEISQIDNPNFTKSSTVVINSKVQGDQYRLLPSPRGNAASFFLSDVEEEPFVFDLKN